MSSLSPAAFASVGLCGGHRTGKTTLAVALADALGLEFVATHTSAVFGQYGLDPSRPLAFEERLFIQERVLDAAVVQWEGQSRPFVTDRTPLDMIAYTLADIRGDTVVEPARLEDYVERCFEVTNRTFGVLAVVQPGIALIFEPGKAALNRAYIEHLNVLVLGLVGDERLRECEVVRIGRAVVDLSERVRVVQAACGRK